MIRAAKRIGLLLGILLLSLAGWAQEEIPECKPGKLVPDYNMKECMFGDLSFKFGKITTPHAKETCVMPVPNGFTFKLPLPEPKQPDAPLFIARDEKIPYQVKGMKADIFHARLAGDVVSVREHNKDLLVTAALFVGDSKREKAVVLSLGLFGSTETTFSAPVKAGTFIQVSNEFVVHAGKPPGENTDASAPVPEEEEDLNEFDCTAKPPPKVIVFSWTDTFTPAKKDATQSELEFEPEP